MFKHRFSPYIVGTCIVAFFALAYIGIRAYQNHVEFKTFILGFEVFQTAGSDARRADIKSKNSVSDSLDQPPVTVRYAEAIKIGEPSSEGYHVTRSEDQPLVPQWVETPDGTIRVVYTSPDKRIKEGDAIPKPPTDTIDTIQQFWDDLERTGDGWLTIEAEEIPDHIPESERHEYVEKLVDAKERGISIEELERRLASGELKIESAPLTPEDERMINTFLEARGLEGLTDHGKQTPTGEGEYQQRISDATVPDSAGERGDASARSEASPVTDDPGNAAQIHHGTGHAHEPTTAKMPSLTAESIETQLREGVFANSFDKARQLIDQYGTEEGLRRLREMDPEAAQQFEREHLSEPSHEVPDEVESSTQ